MGGMRLTVGITHAQRCGLPSLALPFAPLLSDLGFHLSFRVRVLVRVLVFLSRLKVSQLPPFHEHLSPHLALRCGALAEEAGEYAAVHDQQVDVNADDVSLECG